MLGQQDKGDSSREEGFLKPLVYQSQPTAPRQSVAFASEDSTKLKSYLDAPVDACEIQFRPSAQGSVAYIEGWKALSLANEAFGFNGWSSEILQLGTDFLQVESGRVSLGVTCVVRVTLRDGTFHEDIGYGSAENQKSKAGAFEKARKEAVTDAMKRALRMFGNRLGNCAYDKAFLRQVRSGTLPQKRPPAAPPSTEMPPSRMPLTNVPNVKISENVPPADFVPKWQHPKASGSHGGPNPQVNPNQAHSDFDSELVMTEERNHSRRDKSNL